MPLLSPAQVAEALASLPGWTLSGKEIRKTHVFKNFAEAMGFATSVAILAEKAFHHPDIDIRWNKVTLALSTHDEGGLTEKDIQLAEKIDALGNS